MYIIPNYNVPRYCALFHLLNVNCNIVMYLLWFFSSRFFSQWIFTMYYFLFFIIYKRLPPCEEPHRGGSVLPERRLRKRSLSHGISFSWTMSGFSNLMHGHVWHPHGVFSLGHPHFGETIFLLLQSHGLFSGSSWSTIFGFWYFFSGHVAGHSFFWQSHGNGLDCSSLTLSHFEGHSSSCKKFHNSGVLQSQVVAAGVDTGTSSGSLSTMVAGFQHGHFGFPSQPHEGAAAFSTLSVKIGETFSGSLSTMSAAVVTGLQSGHAPCTERTVRANAARRNI